MDSFCFSAPPCPTKKPFLESSVPDASLLLNAPPPNTYQAWRNQCDGNQPKKVSTSILKKVRFNNPTVPPFQQTEMNCNNAGNEANQGRNIPNTQYNTPPLNKVLKNKPFHEIYMANIPNRQLDLSLLDLSKPVSNTCSNNINHPPKPDENQIERSIETLTPPQKNPTTYKEFLEMQKNIKDLQKSNEIHQANGCITDIFNYTSPKIEPSRKPSFKEAQMTKIVSNTQEPLSIRMYNFENPSDRINMPKKTPSPNLNNSYETNVTEKENICYNNVDMKQQMLQSRNDYNAFDLKKDLHHFRTQTQQTGQKCDSSVQTSIIDNSKRENEEKQVTSTEIAKNSDEPTVKDLLKIIQQQNEQLLVLQKQVANLLDFKDSQKRIEPNNQRISEEKSIQHAKEPRDYLNSAGSTPRKGPLPKFSIDLMTSFEVSFRPQQNMYQRKQRDYIAQEPKIREIVENAVEYNTDPGKRITDPSLYLQDPIRVQENCPSPEPSINIDMKDYESSEEDDEDSSSDIGASFYKKMMDQVNKVIQNAQRQTTFDGRLSGNEELKERTLTKVRDATIKHLKKIGMNFSPIEEVSNSNCSSISEDATSEQINQAVKQLLMKYLPDDQLSKLTRDNEAMNKKRNTEKIVLNARGPQFSFATVQFMKKYDLIASDGNDAKKMPNIRERAKPARIYRGANPNNPKILDISKLKQQPKLL